MLDLTLTKVSEPLVHVAVRARRWLTGVTRPAPLTTTGAAVLDLTRSKRSLVA